MTAGFDQDFDAQFSLMEVGVPVFMGAAIALMVALVVVAHRKAKKHRAALEAWAAERGWQIIDRDTAVPATYSAEPFNARGDGPVAKEILYGTWRGRAARSFLYQYTTTSTSTDAQGHTTTSTTTHSFHVVSLALPVVLPRLSLTREGLGTRIAKAFGGEDIQFESEAFNKAWRIVSPDKRFAHNVIHPQVIDRLMQADARGRPLHVDGAQLFTWAPGQHDLAAIEPRLELLTDVVELIPRFVWQDNGYDPLSPPVS